MMRENQKAKGWAKRTMVASAVSAALMLTPAWGASVYCTNCATSAQASLMIENLTLGFNQVSSAIQGAAVAETAAIEGSTRMATEAQARIQRDMATSQAKIGYKPLDPCTVTAMTNATTGGENDVMRDRGADVGRHGGGVVGAGLSASMQTSMKIAKGLQPAPSPEVQASLASSGACQTFVDSGKESTRKRMCQAAGLSTGNSSGYPDADIRAETLFDGPQKSDKIVRKLTYQPNSKEEAAVEAFLRNLEAPMDLRELTKGELQTDAGRHYLALRDAYEAHMSLATKPLRDQALLLRANPNTKGIVAQLLDSDDEEFVRKYLDTAYPRYKSDGISIAELINLEAERRYKNPKWFKRMAEAPDRQLLQEQVQMQAAQLWMTAMLLERLQQLAMIQGNTAAASVRAEKWPALVDAHRAAQR
ncbi:MAG: hypothetical protein P3W87_006445 [Gammaproteobacteria bacterium]|nr:hypothetical protein [Gammaproteobacteria bacterium]